VVGAPTDVVVVEGPAVVVVGAMLAVSPLQAPRTASRALRASTEPGFRSHRPPFTPRAEPAS